MSYASTDERAPGERADVREIAAGHGRHRGPVSTGGGEATPRGRHRKPAGETEAAA
ncbi:MULTISPECIES: hypothetical protein [unclassified Streptomyces]|uniref:hypothetical protein n=1 Tax=unclassified Streptomyces TaxID=2593676 RepID=UPI0019056D18|nr:hypothetical protein [Streptomyces sp. HSG2]